MSKVCPVCAKSFTPTLNDRPNSWEKRVFCSSKCCNSRSNKGQFKNGHPPYENEYRFSTGHTPWNKNSTHLVEEKNPMWKGDMVGYDALHRWVSRNLGAPSKCEDCGKEGLFHQKIHWANKSGEYQRDKNDWIRLCARCHRRFDIKNNLINTWHRKSLA